MAENSIAEDIDSSFTAVPAVSQELLPSQEVDDIFLTIQRATFAVSKIYNDLFATSRADFVSELSELCSTSELRFARDMLAAVVKRKLGQCNIGNLTERRGTNVKDNLLKDTYNLYSLGEKSIQALPKNTLRCDNRLHDQEVQTDSCLSSTIFASKADVESLKSEFEPKLSALRKEFISRQCLPSIPVNYLPESLTIFLNLYQSPVIHLLKYQLMLSIPHKALRRHIKMKLFQLTNLIRSRQEKFCLLAIPFYTEWMLRK